MEGLEAIAALLRGRRIVALTGAGVSTESGIPDYRGQGRRPTSIHHRDFVRRPEIRRHYWARSAAGWPRVSQAQPNPAHEAIAALEAQGACNGVITQNVDGLHGEAGSERIVELHGALRHVRCLECSVIDDRDALQIRLLDANPGLTELRGAAAPDGDSELPAEIANSLDVPPCLHCGGVLMPDVVFHGGAVPRDRVDAAYTLLDEAEALFVAGSSLTVWSGYRFVRAAAEQNKAVAILNLGPTRGDALADVRVDARAGEALPLLVEMLGA